MRTENTQLLKQNNHAEVIVKLLWLKYELLSYINIIFCYQDRCNKIGASAPLKIGASRP